MVARWRTRDKVIQSTKSQRWTRQMKLSWTQWPWNRMKAATDPLAPIAMVPIHWNQFVDLWLSICFLEYNIKYMWNKHAQMSSISGSIKPLHVFSIVGEEQQEQAMWWLEAPSQEVAWKWWIFDSAAQLLERSRKVVREQNSHLIRPN